MVVLYAMPQYQVLSTGGRANRVSLNKAKTVESTFQCRGLEKTAGDGKAAQSIQRNQHDSNCLTSSPNEASAVDAHCAAARKYPQVQPSRTDDIAIYFQGLPTE